MYFDFNGISHVVFFNSHTKVTETSNFILGASLWWLLHHVWQLGLRLPPGLSSLHSA